MTRWRLWVEAAASARGWGPSAPVRLESKRLRVGARVVRCLRVRRLLSLRQERSQPVLRLPLKCAENGDIDTPGHVAFDKLHFIL